MARGRPARTSPFATRVRRSGDLLVLEQWHGTLLPDHWTGPPVRHQNARMTSLEVTPEIVRFYSETVDEADRLVSSADGRLEMTRTQELLRRHLPPPPACVLDIGGGPGTTRAGSSRTGTRFTWSTPFPSVEQARATGAASNSVTPEVSPPTPSRDDVVLMLGPPYHLRNGRTGTVPWQRLVVPEARRAAGGRQYQPVRIAVRHAAYAHLHKESMRESIGNIPRHSNPRREEGVHHGVLPYRGQLSTRSRRRVRGRRGVRDRGTCLGSAGGGGRNTGQFP